MCVRLLRPLVFGAVILVCGFWAEAQQPNRKPPSGVIPPYRLKTPVPKALVGSPDRRQAPAKPPAASQPGIKVLTAKPQPATPAFRWDLPRDQRVPPGAPAPGVPQPNPWDFFRLLIPDPEFEEGAPWPEPSRSAGPPPKPAEPTAEQISRLTNDQLHTLLKMAADSMSDGLDQLKTGDGWKKHLELEVLQQEFSQDARQQLDPMVADGMKFGDLTVAEGIKRGDLTLAAGVKRGDLSTAAGMKFGDLTVADGTKLGNLTIAEGMKQGNLTLEEGVKLGDLEAALGVKPADMTIAETVKRGNLTVTLGVEPGDLTVAEAIKRGNLTVTLGVKDADPTGAKKVKDASAAFQAEAMRSGKGPDATGAEEVKDASAAFQAEAMRSGKGPDATGAEEVKDASAAFQAEAMRSGKRPDSDARGYKDAASRERLAKIADRFEKVAEKPEYKKIAAVRGFQTMRRGLREHVLPPTERQAHVLSASLPILTSALDRQRTGAGWKTFLKLEELKQLLDSEDEWQPEDLDKLVEILDRFEKVRRDPQYAVIARMRGFEVTYEALNALVESLEEESVGSLPPPPTQ